MSRRVIFALAAVLSSCPGPAAAEWRPGGTPLSSHPEIVTGADGRGGVFGANNPAALFPRLYRLDARGDSVAGWPTTGLELAPGASMLEHASIRTLAIVPDGTGGLFALAREKSPYLGHGGFWYPDQYYVHRRSAAGSIAPGWTPEGVLLASPYMDPRYVGLHPARMVADGQDGVLVAWLASGYSAPEPGVVVQRVTPGGSAAWGTDGILLCAGPRVGTLPALVADGHGGALVFWGCWNESGTALRIRGQHVSPAGARLWETSGHEVSTFAYDRVAGAIPLVPASPWTSYPPAIAAVPDGASGAILAWAGARGADLAIVAARVGPDGRSPWSQDVNVCSAPGEQASVNASSWLAGGAVLAWRDGRAGADVGIYAQAMDRHGRAQWMPDGVRLGHGTGERGPALVVNDRRSGAFVAWSDPVNGGGVFACRLLPSGQLAQGWDDGGTLVSAFAEPDYGGSVGLGLVEGAHGTAIATWTSWRRGSYATLLGPHGPVAERGEAHEKPRPVPLAGAPENGLPSALAILGVQPHPATSGSRVRFRLPLTGDVSLELFDLAGRRVWSRELRRLAPGEHLEPLSIDPSAPAGLYLLRARQGGRVATARVVLLSATP